MINEFRMNVISPALRSIGLWSRAAENLVVGTALQESGLTFLRQWPKGPALGVYQIEPATHSDIYMNYLHSRHELRAKVQELEKPWTGHNALIFNFHYATAIARIVYRRRPEPLPHDDPDNPEKLAYLWKVGYNTTAGRGLEEEFIRNYKRILE